MTPERFARGMPFDDYVKFTRSPENLAREYLGFRHYFLASAPPPSWGKDNTSPKNTYRPTNSALPSSVVTSA